MSLSSVVPSALAGSQDILNFGINTFWFPGRVGGVAGGRGAGVDYCY